MEHHKGFLIILDGWGLNDNPKESAVEKADTPCMDQLLEEQPHATLRTHGTSVGLPEGQMGNSEVGHLNLGAGRIVYQDLVKINRSFENGSFEEIDVFNELLDDLEARERPLHIMGLLSNGGVHSHIDHLFALCDILKSKPDIRVYLHLFLDGRDTDPKAGKDYLRQLLDRINSVSNIQWASVIGRYFAMDRDNRWDRTAKAWNLLIEGEGKKASKPVQAVETYYEQEVTDEFMEPIIAVDENSDPVGTIDDGDGVLFFNFRSDRPRQLVDALVEHGIPDEGIEPLDLHFVTMTRYDKTFENIRVLFEKDPIPNTMGEWISNQGLTQLRIAETEKYAHVTYFFSGGREDAFEGEERILIPSPQIPTYELQPEMSAREVTENAVHFIEDHKPDFVCLNYANPDMVGHTGYFEAAVAAVEAVDEGLKELVKVARTFGYEVLVIADHGNADYMVNPDGSPNTAHSKNPVPFVYIGHLEDSLGLEDGILADVAPTLLHLMNLDIPGEMEGTVRAHPLEKGVSQ